MTTLNQVRKNVIARKEKAEAERIARERATANSVELLLERADVNARRSIALASILAPINEALTLLAIADQNNQDITLEQAGSMHKAFDLFDKAFASVFEAIDNGVLVEVDGGADACDCGDHLEDAVPAGTTPEELVATLMQMATKGAVRPH